MYQNHYYVEVMLKERHSELLNQSRILSQLRVNETEPRVNITLGPFFQRIKMLLTPGRFGALPVMPAKDCVPGPECQIC